MKRITILLLFMLTLLGQAQVSNYTFTASNGVYEDIGLEGSQLGLTTSENQYFINPAATEGSNSTTTGPGFEIGFNFVYNGITYNKFAVSNDGWITLGSSSFTPNVTLNIGSSNDRLIPISKVNTTLPDNACATIAALAVDIKAQGHSVLSYLTYGNSGSKVLVVQWAGYRKSKDGDADNFNFQIRLYETTNVVKVVYGEFACNLTPNIKCQVGLRAAPSAIANNFSNRTSATEWTNSVAGTVATDAMSLSNTSFPKLGLTYTWTPSTFGGPKNLTTTAITSQSATINWGFYDPAPDGSQYVYSKSSTLPTGSGTSTTATSANLSSLDPNTTYYVFIRTYKGSVFTSWLPMGSFKTKCLDATDFSEDFDTYAVGSLPDCWTNTGTTGNSTLAIINIEGSNRLQLFSSTLNTVPCYAVLPAVSNLQANDHRLRFKAYTDSDIPDLKTITIGYYDSTGNFVELETKVLGYKGVANTKEFIITPVGVQAGAKNLVLKVSAAKVFVDNISWEPSSSQTCAANVVAPLAKMITANSAVFSWTKGGTETAWQYVYAPTSVTNPYTLQGINVPGTSPTVTLSGLSPATAYKAWIRSKCADGTLGAWVGPVVFSTTCTSGTEIFENFDTIGLNEAYPPCWRKLGSADVFVGPGGLSTPYALQLKATTVVTDPLYSIIVLPPMSNTGAGTHRLKFKAKVDQPNPGNQVQLVIGWLDDVSDPTTFHELQTINDLTTTEYKACGSDSGYIFGSTPSSPYLAFKNPGNIVSNSVRIDDLVWEPYPVNCPDVTNMVVEVVKSSAAKLKWTTSGTETAWQYAVAPATVNNPYSLAAINVPSPVVSTTTVKASISGLTPGTAQKIWIRSKCGDNSFGAWNGPLLVTTPCAPVTEFSENFDSVAALPNCWKSIGTGNIVVQSVSGKPSPSAPYMLNISSNNSTTNVGMVALPGVSNMGAGTHRLRFSYQPTQVEGKLDIGYLRIPTDPSSFISLLDNSLIVSPGDAKVYTREFLLDSTLDDIEVLALKNLGDPGSIILIDDLAWEVDSDCQDITNPTIAELTDKSISVSVANGSSSPSMWEYAVGPMSAADTSSLYVYSMDNTSIVKIENLSPGVPLQPNTDYKIWVRSKCSAYSYGSWIQILAKTICSGISDFSENFDASTTLPQCWKIMGTGISSVSVNITEPNDINKLYISSGALANGYAIAVMPPLNNTNATDHILKFRFKGKNVGDKVEVGFMTNIADPDSFYSAVPKLEYSAGSSTVSEVITIKLGANPLSNIIAFKVSGVNEGVYLDFVSWAAAPTTPPACVTATATIDANCGNYATVISWPAVDSADTYRMDIGTTAGASDVVSNMDLGIALSYSFVGNNGTKYYYKVKPVNYAGAATTCTEQTFETIATKCYCVSVPASVDNKGISDIQLGKTNFVNTAVSYKHFNDTVNLAQGAKNNLQLTFDTLLHSYNTIVWIDLNDNFEFEDSEKLFTGNSGTTSPNTLDASFNMPATAKLGAHRMRISAGDVELGFDQSPCYNGIHAVTLDFNVNVLTPDQLGVDNFETNNFAFYPNPVKNVLNISLDQEISDVVVVNLLGQQVISKSVNSNKAAIDMSGLSSGTYLVKIIAGSQSKTIKAVKE